MFIFLGAPSVYFDIKVPSAIDLPADIVRVALIDRSNSESEVVNLFEKGLLSSITGNSDRISKYCLDGIFNQLKEGETLKPLITGIIEKRKGTALDLPRPMQWFEIENICEKFNADAVISLEIFSKQNIENVAEVKVGFRIYDPGNKRILDEFQYFHGIGKGGSIPHGEPGSLAINALNSDDAMKQASYIAGTIYGKRISPFWVRVERKYFKKSKRDPKMAEGSRMMEVNDWDAAMQAFSLAIEHGHPKTKGRASLNLAIVYEITGNLEKAFQTAQDGWGKYGNKKARAYSNILQQRLNEIALLTKQESN
jgi:hypothetical protein